MSQLHKALPQRRKRLSLSIRISLWLISVAVLPLLVTIGVSELYARPTLTDQARTALETDARTHAQLINNYFRDRMLDVESLAQVPLAQDFFRDPVGNQGNIPLIVQNGKVVGGYLDPHYTLWALFDLEGKLLLSYSSTNARFQLHGKYAIPPEDVQRLLKGDPFISAVYYDPASKKASVDIYVPSYSFTLKRPLGIVRATLTLDYIQSIVESENGANGNGSYAFIVDENGIRIADPDPMRRFTAIAPLSLDTQQTMLDEARYGQGQSVRVQADDGLNQILTSGQTAKTFELQPAGTNDTYETTQQKLSAVPWTYLVLSPLNTVVAVANQQLIITSIIVLLVLIPVALIGFAVGRRISAPIMDAVGYLTSSSEDLAALAAQQKSTASEQGWVVEASQMGLESVQYYNKATDAAAERVSSFGTDVIRRWQTIDEQTIKQTITNIVKIARYIKEAASLQNTSNEKVATAINVTTQVSEQLASSATSALDASNQLKTVVEDLRSVVGK